jgi:hypothetical protein
VSPEPSVQVILDPSVLFRPQALDVFEDSPELFVVSQSFLYDLQDDAFAPTIALLSAGRKYANDPDRERQCERVLAFCQQATTFSYEEGGPSGLDAEVTTQLLTSRATMARVWADEWVFLQTHSIMFSAARRPLDAFRRAGAAIVEYSRRVLDEVVDVVIPRTTKSATTQEACSCGGRSSGWSSVVPLSGVPS